jgi:hypothetical protein
VRVSAAKFFSAGTGGLVESGLEPDSDEVVINCYRLADRFKQNPTVFLEMPLSQISMHLTYTVKLIEAQRAARERREDDDG